MARLRREGPEPDDFLPLPRDTFDVLVSLADRDRHGYAILQDIAERTDGRIRLSPSTLYAVIKRLLEAALIEELEGRGVFLVGRGFPEQALPGRAGRADAASSSSRQPEGPPLHAPRRDAHPPILLLGRPRGDAELLRGLDLGLVVELLRVALHHDAERVGRSRMRRCH